MKKEFKKFLSDRNVEFRQNLIIVKYGLVRTSGFPNIFVLAEMPIVRKNALKVF